MPRLTGSTVCYIFNDNIIIIIIFIIIIINIIIVIIIVIIIIAKVDGIHSVERFVGDLFSPIFGGPVASGSNDKVRYFICFDEW